MENMQIYDAVKTVPAEARKQIQAGRLKGFTDINPMWRIRVLTEQFGPCGFGWYYTIEREWLEPTQTGEVAAFVRINLFVKVDGEWSQPIVGVGGSAFVANERNGARMSDEAFKMAQTDALSVACKNLGVGAEVYWAAGETKYASQTAQASFTQPHDPTKASPEQVAAIQAAYGDKVAKLLEVNGISRLEDLPAEKANDIMQYLNSRRAS